LVSGTVAYVRVTDVDGGITADGGTESSTAQSAPSTTAPDGSSGAGQTVLGYLEALRNGDADKALSYGEKRPEDTTLLTDDILGKQIAEWPISDIRLRRIGGGDEATAARMYVEVAVTFGVKEHIDTISLTRNPQGGWWIDHTATEYKPASDSAMFKTFSVYGKQLTFGESFFAFPGYLEVTTSNRYIDAAAIKHKLFTDYIMLRPQPFDATAHLNSAGETAVRAAVEQAFARCEGSTLTHPPGCPAYLPAGEDGAVKWGRPEVGLDYFSRYPGDLTVDVSGITYIPITYRNTDGQTVTDRMPWVNTEDVDISSDPPRVIA
jgi:hypothetical protein